MAPTVESFLKIPADQLTPDAEQAFFSSLMTRNKTYKTTFQGRFAEINQYLHREIECGHLRVHHVLDIGISSGVSTLELYEDIHASDHAIDLVGTDILVHASLVRVFPGCRAMVDEEGFPLRFDVFGRGMAPWVRHSDYANGFFLIRKVVNLAFTKIARHILSIPEDGRAERVDLVTPRLLALKGIQILDDDIGQYNPDFCRRFDFIRVANVLNRGYFADATLDTMLRNISHYLSGPGSNLLVVRTHQDLVNHGTLFRVTEGGHFEVVERFGDGSEIENLVLRA
ncbi:MAG: ATP/GTP-binding protein [Rhodanobacteraceae bacterium]|nr:MAG: ATP/GTP-binding protein [Rhodanobacteraceae bacterium]